MSVPVIPMPTGTVTFLFSDIEGSTARWDAHRDAMQAAVRRHDTLVRAAIEKNRGYVFKTLGDAFCAAFEQAADAARAAISAQSSMIAEDWSAVDGLRVRIAIHTGTADERDDDYFGPTVNRTARLLAAGHGDQILLSGSAKDAVGDHRLESAKLVDLGMHRLKDLTAPERVYQLCAPGLRSEFKPLNSLQALRHNLPEQLTPLLGRDEELAAIGDLVQRSRIVSIVGAGGVGKTRVALQVAAELAGRFDVLGDGAWFVDLSPLQDPSLVASAIAGVFDIGNIGESQPLLERVAVALLKKRVLIVLDNCEHVIGEAADVVNRLLRACPGVRVLATSREPLAIAGEEPYRMPTLPVPPPGERLSAQEARSYAAVALFVARAQSAERNFALTDENAPIIADIVRRLDGIALAIELAAPRIKVLTLRQVTQRLDERFKLLTGGSRTALPRQQTLHALIGWSYDLLGEAERSILRQLAVFRGGCTLEAAEAVCSDGRFDDWNTLDLLSSLVDKSLVAVDADETNPRYRLLESTRHFALDRLEEASERPEVAARHCAYFAAVAEVAGRLYWEIGLEAWTRQMRTDVDNFRAALDWSFDGGGDPAVGVEIYAHSRDLLTRHEARAYVERASRTLPSTASMRSRGHLAFAEAGLVEASARAVIPATQAVEALCADDDDLYRSQVFARLAEALGKAGRIQESVALYERAVTAARATGIPRIIGYYLADLAYWLLAAGDTERAEAALDECTPILRAFSDNAQLLQTLLSLAELRYVKGDVKGALDCSLEAYDVERKVHVKNSTYATCGAQLNLASYLLALGKFDEGGAAARQALEIAVKINLPLWAAIGIGHLATLAAENGDYVTAARLIGHVDAEYRSSGDVREPIEQRGYDRTMLLVGAHVPSERIAALLAEGAALDRERAIALAMSIPLPADATADVGTEGVS